MQQEVHLIWLETQILIKTQLSTACVTFNKSIKFSWQEEAL